MMMMRWIARAALRALFCGRAPWWAPAPKQLRTLLEDPEVADLYYELAEWDRGVVEATYGVGHDAERALRVAGFESRVAEYLEAGQRARSWQPALALVCAIAILVGLVGRFAPSDAPREPLDDAYAVRGGDDTAGLRVDLLCIDAEGQLLGRLGERTLACPNDAIVQPVVRDERARGHHVVAFVVQTGPIDQVVPMVPNPSEPSPVKLAPEGREQRVGPARQLALNYEAAPGFVVFVVDEAPLSWARVAPILETIEERTPSAALPNAVSAAFEAQLGRPARAVLVRPFDVTPERK